MKNNIRIALLVTCILSLSACKKYLDIVPDNVATIENAFALRNTAEQYLFTCYSYMPLEGSIYNPALTAGDELWIHDGLNLTAFGPTIARGLQSKAISPSPILSYWDGAANATPLYRGLRDCNIFLENIARVPGMQESEKARWVAEVKFLKAYYHFYLMRMYGPIPLIKENAAVSTELSLLKLKRAPVDECVDYIVQLIDEASTDLPDAITAIATELGRVSKPAALAIKARVLVTAASPLFNGNGAYAGFNNKDGQPLINTAFDAKKWERAVLACKEAIDICMANGMKLHVYPGHPQFALAPETIIQMSIRTSVTQSTNSEMIWSFTNDKASMDELQRNYTPTGLDPSNPTNTATKANYSPSMKMAELFYTKNGVPINEDKTWDFNGRFNLRVATTAEKFNLQPGYTTASLHFDRENRFYADMAFDGGVWYGVGRFDDNNPWPFQAKIGQSSAKITTSRYSATGYAVKKMVNPNNIIGTGSTYTIQTYQFPIMRLADLYLMYAEALNEVGGPTSEAYDYVNLVRTRAGLPTVQVAWANFSTNPGKFNTKNGFRDIIQQERLIELAFEGNRFWDLMRWKRSEVELNQPVYGWDIEQSEAAFYYRRKLLFNQTFSLKNYFWPIAENNLILNENLVQNPGW